MYNIDPNWFSWIPLFIIELIQSKEKDPTSTKVKAVLSRGLFKAIMLKLGLMGFDLIGLTTCL